MHSLKLHFRKCRIFARALDRERKSDEMLEMSEKCKKREKKIDNIC